MRTEISDIFRKVALNMSDAADTPYVEAIERTVDVLSDAFQSGNKLLVFGNGGSAADAQHLCAELVGRFAAERGPLAAIALTTDQALLTAWSNDRGFEGVFSRQVHALGRPGDVAWGISTSGTSANVIDALKRARSLGLKTIGLTGRGAGALAPLCDVLMAAPVTETARIQEVHVVTDHIICAELERRLFHGT
jgi:D-sedoheptulose 7-phosphate isomerase